jgi:hypothetical protein
VRALLRRARTAVDEPSETITAGPIEIDFVRRTVHRDGAEVHLTPTEWSLLRALATHRGRTMTHRQLFNAVWSRSEGDAQQYLRVYVGMVESITAFLDAYVKQTTPIASAELEARLSSSAPHWISARGVPVRARLIPRTGAASRTRR